MTRPEVSRLAKAAHYVISRTEPEKLGAVKLNKILWFADIENYRRTGRAITQVSNYVRLPKGPVPYGIDQALDELKATGAIFERRTQVISFARREFVWLKEPDITSFSPGEIDLLNQAIDAIKDLSAEQISEVTHQDALWKELDNGSPMPIGPASIVARSPTEADMAWAASANVA